MRGDRRALLRLAGAEVDLLLATIGLAVGLGRTAPPRRPRRRVGAVAQVLLAFVAPEPLVPGPPLDLARRALPLRGRPGSPSPRGSVDWVLRRSFVRVLRPGVTVAVFVGVLVALPLGLFDRLLPTQGGRQAIDALLLSTGCLVAAALSTRRRGRARPDGSRWPW